MTKYPYLDDNIFLKYVDELKYKKQYVRIIVLDRYERPIEELAAHVKDGGSVSIDGSSNIRRTSSLTLVMDTSTEEKMKQVIDLLALNKKVEIEVGFKNTTKGVFPQYEQYDIIWYPMGIFYTQSPSFNHGIDGLSITLPLSDKMCLLTGDSGGTFPADVDLDKMETYVPEEDEDGNKTGRMLLQYDVPIPMKQIIRELVNHWGGEQLGKIIVDFPDEVKVVQYLKQDTFENNRYIHTQKIGEDETRIGYIQHMDDADVKFDIPAGKDVGFIYSDFTYPSDKGLTAAKGSAVTGALDSIKNSLENYEYFYDRYGNFIFQEIKNYLNTSQSTDILNALECLKGGQKTDYTLDRFRTKAVYSFDNSNLIAAYSNNPQYELIKNDFVIWGQNSSGYPIRYHVAIDKMPVTEDKKYEGYCFLKMPMVAADIVYTNEDVDDVTSKYYTDTIVAMQKVDQLPSSGLLGVYYYFNNQVYYYDGCEFLRLIDEIGTDNFNKYYKVYNGITPYISKDNWRTQLFLDGVVTEISGTVANDYYSELKSEWPKIIDIDKLMINSSTPLTLENIKKETLDLTGITYYLDILDTSEKISQFSISNIGRRTEAIKVDTVNCIFENDIPGYIYIRTNVHDFTRVNNIKQDKPEAQIMTDLANAKNEFSEQIEKIISQQYIPVLLTIEDYKELQNGGVLFSAYEAAKERIYQCTGYNEKITLDIMPIYHLEPNTRISIKDIESGISGDYIINSIEAPLDINSTMSLTCTRALDKL